MPVTRLDNIFAELAKTGRKTFAAFLMAGDPDEKNCLDLLFKLAEQADIIELGMPFTDPMADGPAVQAAGLRALSSGASMEAVFSIVHKFRSKNTTTPLILMGYLNPVLAFGEEKFFNSCKSLGVDGVIIVDLPPEEAEDILDKAQQNNIALIRLVTPTTDAARLDKILSGASGFLYYVAITGVTGTARADAQAAAHHIAKVKARTSLPVLAGFGIKTAEDAAAMARGADGVVVGSALVECLARNEGGVDELLKKAAMIRMAINA